MLARQALPELRRRLAQRDLPSWGLAAQPQVTDRLLRLVAAVHGQVWNASQLGQSLGLSYKTVNSYLDYLIGAYLIRRRFLVSQTTRSVGDHRRASCNLSGLMDRLRELA